MKPYFEDEDVAIYHGDCRELLPAMARVDLVLTDPPYGINYDSSHKKHGGGVDYGNITWDREPYDPAPILALKSASIIWGGNCFASRLPDNAAWLTWVKISTSVYVNASVCRQSDSELAWTNCIGRSRVFQHTWIGAARDTENGTPNYHPTQKPLALMRWCLGLVPNVQTVIDPYMGSGTTLRAAKDMGIKAIGIEIEERYCEIAAKRMAQQSLPFESFPVDAAKKRPSLF